MICLSLVLLFSFSDEHLCKRDQSDVLIVMSMYLYSSRVPETDIATMVIISGDVDNVSTIATLKDRGHTILVAVPEDCHPSLLGRGTRDWYYLEMFKGNKPIQLRN